jgi:hypothetical protein
MYRHNSYPHLGAWWPIVVIVVLLLLAFEVWMLVDAALNKKISDRAKTWWIIGMVLVHPLVAIFYFFTDHKA